MSKDELTTENDTQASLKQLVPNNSAVVALIIGGLTAGVMSGHLNVPPWLIDVIRGAAVAGIIGYVGGSKIAELLSEPPEVEEVVEVDAERDVAQTWFVPPDWWEEREEADSGAWFRRGSENWGVRELDYDPDEERAIVEQAPLRSEMTDDELETWKSAVYETRGKQREKAREGEFIKARLTGIGQSIEHEVWDALARMRSEKRNVKPEAVFGVLDEELGDVKATMDHDSESESEKIAREVLRSYGRDDVEIDPDSFERLDEQDFDNIDLPNNGGDGR